MTEDEKKFLETNFKAGEYSQVTILVRNEQVTRLIEVLGSANLTLAIIPSARAKVDFETDDTSKGPVS